jgi:deoxyribonuclease-4
MTKHPLIGAHVSIAGGIANAPARAKAENCETFQCFTRSPQGGKAPELTPAVLSDFKAAMAAAGMDRFYIHAPYYINLASLAGNIRYGSIKVLRDELERGSLLGAKYVMAHPGSYTGQDQDEAIGKVSDAIAKILDGYTGTCGFLVEISAGTGNVLGDTFEEVAAMIAPVKGQPGFAGVCFDTCHAFASGYDFRTPASAQDVLDQFDKTIGLEWLKLTHVNDSMVGLGEKRDRHEHIGQGHIGLEGLEALLDTPPFRAIDWILETETAGRLEDVASLQAIQKRK